MIDGLRPYPEYRDSGVPWLGQVPAEWAVRKLRACGTVVGGMTPAMNEPLFWRGDIPWVTPKDMKRAEIDDSIDRVTAAALQGTSLRMVPAGAVLFVVRGMILAKRVPIAVTTAPVTINQDMKALVPTPRTVSAAYLANTLTAAQDALAVLIDEAGHGTRRLPTERWRDVYVPIPTLEEQTTIVRFLNCADRRIRRYIRAKQKLIKLLEEQKHAIIQRAVTRGLDLDARLKPSAVEWLDEVPERWALARLKFIATDIVDCLHATPVYSEDGGYPAIRTADVQPGRLLLESVRRVDEEHYLRWTARMAPEEGDILYTREGERFGIAALVPAAVRLCISQRMMAFRINGAHNAAYVMWQINCRHVYAQAAADLIGAAAPHVNVERIKNFWLALPSRLEQDEIVAGVADAVAAPSAATARAQSEISLLLEYRTRLITDVVTGKLDVRGAAARLPDDAEESLDEPATITYAEEEASEDPDAASQESEA